MRILVIGSGGREHAMVHALRSADADAEIHVAPGNAGTATVASNEAMQADDVSRLLDFALARQIDLTIVGPEQPLVLGIADTFRSQGLAVVGPSALAARLEGSKVFAKAFMSRHNIPTAQFRSFGQDAYEDALTYTRKLGAPVVVKASGLAAGKGAVVCSSLEDAERTVREMLLDGKFGSSGREIVVEEFMPGEEASIFAVCDASSYVLLSPAQDHKRVGVGDTGLNTGGMGAYAPAPIVSHDLLERVEREIIQPTLNGLAAEGAPYNGFLYVGLMIEAGVPRVVEYNCRMGDPEAQVVLPMLQSSFLDLMTHVASGTLDEYRENVRLREDTCACVVVCSGGYPGEYRKGFRIDGLEELESVNDVHVFHAGTAIDQGEIVTSGGRVLGITGRGESLDVALTRAYDAIGLISFEGMYFRKDIGQKGLKHLELA